jgi:peptidoglycan hydrolase-like protein with peptidoglycan-binding domain
MKQRARVRRPSPASPAQRTAPRRREQENGPDDPQEGRDPSTPLLGLQKLAGNNAVASLMSHASTIHRWFGFGGVMAPAKPLLKKGSKGPEVLALQQRLNELGAAVIEDGDFGSLTKDAVIAFQRDYGLSPDGVVGSETEAALKSASVIVTATPTMGRYKKWSQLSSQERKDWEVIGYTKETWNKKVPPPTAYWVWSKLTQDQRAAATRLGYTRESWNTNRDREAETAAKGYAAEEKKMRAKAKGLPPKFIGSLRAKAILDDQFGDIAKIKLPKVQLLDDAGMKTAYEGIYGAGSYPAAGLRGFMQGGTIYLNQKSVWLGTAVHESLHHQEHPDWDGFAYPNGIGEGATTILTELAVTAHGYPVTTHSYPDQVSLVNKMNTHSSLDKMKKAYFKGGADVTTYKSDVTAGLKAGKTWANFKAMLDAKNMAGAEALLK